MACPTRFQLLINGIFLTPKVVVYTAAKTARARTFNRTLPEK